MSLFGQPASSANQPTPSQGTSFFSGLNAPKPAQPASSPFGNPPQAQQPTASLFGSTATGQSQPQAAQSLFGSTLNTGGQQNGNGTLNTQQPTDSGRQSQGPNQQTGAYFDTLLQKSRKRTHGDNSLEELPSLQLGLGDLRDRIKRLAPPSMTNGADGRAHYLLAASGVEPGSAVRDLSQFDSQAKRQDWAPQPTDADTDVDSYITKLQTQTTLSMIAEGLSRSARDFDRFLEENASMEWDSQRNRIYQHFGIKSRAEERATKNGESTTNGSGGFGRSRRNKSTRSDENRNFDSLSGSAYQRQSMQRSVIGIVGPVGSLQQSLATDSDSKGPAYTTLSSMPSGRLLREKEIKFAEKINHLNESRLHKSAYPLLHEFGAVEAQNPGDHTEQVLNAYKAVVEIVGEHPDLRSFSEPNVVKERQFASAWTDEAPNSVAAIDLRKRILRGTARHLEKQCFQTMETLLAKNPREANLGGIPNVLSKVKAYVRLRASRKDLAPDSTGLQTLDGEAVWAIIFYLLRTGHVQEAADYVHANKNAFRAIDRYFPHYISEYNGNADRRLPPDMHNRINNEYGQRFRIAPENSVDPFRMSCYKVIGRCGLTEMTFSGLHQDLMDWAWLHFVVAREVNLAEEHAGDVFTLTNVQKSVKDLGDLLAAKGPVEQKASSGVYFYLQIICGRFEYAIQSLYEMDYAAALHFAIGLGYYGLLNVSDPITSEGRLLTTSVTDRPQINFAQMIGWYTRDFRAANVTAAVDYLTLICLNGDLPGGIGSQQVLACHEALRGLVLESREFAKLLGDMRLDGQRITGAIEERMKLLHLVDTDDFMRTVIMQAASIADDSGRVTDAVLLYDLAGEYDNVITITNRALSEAVAVEIGEEKSSLTSFRPGPDQGIPGHRGSLSLTSVEDPVKLAQTITAIYNGKPMYHEKITPINKETCRVLLRMNEAKSKVEAQNWTGALDIIASLQILPLEAHGDSNIIRQFAGKYAAFPETITRNIPNLIMWTGRSCEEQRSRLANSQYNSNDGTRRHMIEDLKRKAKDLTMYAGFLKYRLPPWVNDLLARIAAE
ncbi:hypothetical protein VF21_01816 [Pseudogymnoascus sp. 05NY08]|nr:hypothetical protein VF21_01816 [Pseudogymnoascus sp. 05NY08]